MKTQQISFFLMLFFALCQSQINPVYVTTLTDKWIESSYLDKNTNNLYLCYSESGEIKKLNLNNPSAGQTVVVSGLSLPTAATVMSNRLYFIQASNGLDDNDMPIPNTGKLCYIDLAQQNPTIVTIMSNLNAPFRIAAGSDFVIIDENTISSSDPDDFDQQIISKINLTGPVVKTPITTRIWAPDNPSDEAFQHFQVIGNIMYSNAYYTSEIGSFYKTSLDTNVTSQTHSFTQKAPYSFAINQNMIYFADGYSPGNTYKTALANSNTTIPVTTNFSYSGNITGFLDWNFDANGNAYILAESNVNIYLFKYNSQQLQTADFSRTNSVQIFPNPVADVLHLSPALGNIKIIDLSGKIAIQISDAVKDIPVKNLIPGNYILSGKDASGKAASQRFIKK